MRLDDPFDDLLASLAGFHRSWLIYVGLELGLFQALRDAGERGMTSAELAQAVDCAPIGIDVWAWGGGPPGRRGGLRPRPHNGAPPPRPPRQGAVFPPASPPPPPHLAPAP